MVMDDGHLVEEKPLRFVRSSRKDIRELPRSVKFVFSQALFDAQTGNKHPNAKSLKGFGRAGVLEVVEDDRSGTYRAVYTVQFAGIVYVLHAFQKKSKTGSKTPNEEIYKIKARSKEAEADYAEFCKEQKSSEDADR